MTFDIWTPCLLPCCKVHAQNHFVDDCSSKHQSSDCNKTVCRRPRKSHFRPQVGWDPFLKRFVRVWMDFASRKLTHEWAHNLGFTVDGSGQACKPWVGIVAHLYQPDKCILDLKYQSYHHQLSFQVTFQEHGSNTCKVVKRGSRGTECRRYVPKRLTLLLLLNESTFCNCWRKPT